MKKIILILLMLVNQFFAQNLDLFVDSLLMRYNNAPGAAVGLFHDGEIVFSKGYGKADLENNISITDSTNFRLASVTKQFTATAILILQQNGKLKLEDKIIKFFPCLKNYAADITIKHLLTHTSGLPDYEDLIDSKESKQLKDKDVLELLCKQDSLKFPAGTKYKYSNSGYALLSLIVEQLSGMSFAEYLNQNIFGKILMNNSIAYENGISEVKNRAFGYALIDGEIKFNDQSLTSAVLGDGGIYSSVKDMFKWDQSLYSNLILSEENLSNAFYPYTEAESENVFYGYGWRIDEYRNMKRVYHTGSTCGFSNAFVRIPEAKLSVIVLMNQRNQPALLIANSILEYYLVKIFKK